MKNRNRKTARKVVKRKRAVKRSTKKKTPSKRPTKKVVGRKRTKPVILRKGLVSTAKIQDVFERMNARVRDTDYQRELAHRGTNGNLTGLLVPFIRFVEQRGFDQNAVLDYYLHLLELRQTDHKGKRLSSTAMVIDRTTAGNKRKVQRKNLLQQYGKQVSQYHTGKVKYTPYSDSILAKRLIAAKKFTQEMFEQGYLPRDYGTNVPSIQVFSKDVDGLTLTDITKITGYIDTIKNPRHKARARAMFALLIFHFLRSGELATIERSDIRGRVLSFREKGKRQKTKIVLNSKAQEAIAQHIKINNIGDGALFQSFSPANKQKDRGMTVDGCRTVLQRVLIESGVSSASKLEKHLVTIGKNKEYKNEGVRRAIPHLLRHYGITEVARAWDGNLVKVKSASRHRSVHTVARYVADYEAEVVSEEVAEIFEGVTI